MGHFKMGRTRVLHALVWILKKTLKRQDLKRRKRRSRPLEVMVGFIKYGERRVRFVPWREKGMGVRAKRGL